MRGLEPVIFENARIPMRDGVTLSARVWMPPGPEDRFPAIIEAIPYRKSDGTVERDATTHKAMSAAGYACIRVDLRGSGASGGFFDDEYSEQELEDIEDVIAWAVAAPWSSRAVGIMGISWGGINALLTAARRPKGLKAAISAASVTDRLSQDIHYKGGCQLTSNSGWAAQAMSILSLPPDPETVEGDWRKVWQARLDRTVFLHALWGNAVGPTDYWQRTALQQGAIDIPVLGLAGHRDGYRNLPMKLLEIAGPESKAILGPWDHNYPNISSFGPWLDFAGLAVAWWDRWLKGVENGIDTDPALTVFILDGRAPQTGALKSGHWLTVPERPNADCATLTLHLTDDGLCTTPGQLDATVESNLMCGTSAGDFFSRSGSDMLHPAEQTQDDLVALCFESAALDDDKVLLGEATLELRVASDTPNAQLIARLCDVAPDGGSRLITLAMLNLAFRQGQSASEPMIPGKTEKVTLAFDAMGYLLPNGHKVRLALSTSYWPFVWPEADASRLFLTQGSLRLPLYEGAVDSSVHDLQQRPKVPAVTRQLREPSSSQKYAVEEDRWTRRREIDQGQTHYIHNGLERFGRLSEVFSIDLADPATSSMEVTWHAGLAGKDFETETVLTTKTTANRSEFRHWARLEAFDAGERIFSREFNDTAPRDVTMGSEGVAERKHSRGEKHE